LGFAYPRPNVWLLPAVYLRVLPGEQDYILAMRTFLRDRFLFATGYPFCPVEDILDRYHGFGLPDDVLAGVLGGNARRLFRLDDPTPGGTSLRA
jgi:predicted TIM-barrel fold metal-dependent hydrolase